MKIFFLTRLFSGLENSFETGKWSPNGVPTIYKIIERIDKEEDVHFYFISKDSGKGYFSNWNKKKDVKISVEGLINEVNILSGMNYYPSWMGRKLRIYLREIRQLIYIIYKIFKIKPDILYCDNANIITGAIISRIQTKIPVVFRLMGVNQLMRQTLNGWDLYNRINKWAYKSPFATTICTQDGSGIEKWIDGALSKKTDVQILINGTDNKFQNVKINSKLNALPSDKIIIMFIGKLEKTKGCYEYVHAIINLIKSNICNFHSLVIGNGTEEENILKIINKEKANDYFTFIKSIPHNQILYAHSISNIYVSMNHLGNLSNANLEAINANNCMIIPSPQKETGIDEVTYSLLGDSVIYVPINHHKKLSDELKILIKSKIKRLEMSKKIETTKKKFLWSWDERIDFEFEILKNLKKNNNY